MRIIRSQREGKQVFYTLDDDHVLSLIDTISKIEPDARIVEREDNLQVDRTGNTDDNSLLPESSNKRPFFSRIPETVPVLFVFE